MCNCGREKVVFFCKEPGCKSNRAQVYYCMFCSDSEEDRHPHGNVRIVKEINIIHDGWVKLKAEIAAVYGKAVDKFTEYGALI